MPPRNETKPKSVRKPLRDVSNKDNNNYNGGGKFSKSVNKKEKLNEKQIEEEALDRLLLVQSDLSSLLKQINELVVQAFKVKTASKQGRKEVESFTNALSDMLSTLKPWGPRFQKMVSSPVELEKQMEESVMSESVSTTIGNDIFELRSPEVNKEETLISPSPLVSWRANCTIEKGRHLFLLTPLPMSKALSSKNQTLSKSVFERITSNITVEVHPLLTIPGDANDDLLEGVAIKLTPSKPSDSTVDGMGNTLESGFVSSPMFSKRDHSMLMMTPCLKMSPPKSCALLDPILESTHKPNARVSTPFPVRLQTSSESSESSVIEDSDGLAFKYPELLGIQQACKSGIAKKDLEASPVWLFSPPKSCVLLEPQDEKPVVNAPADTNLQVAAVTNPPKNASPLKEKENDVQSTCQQDNKSFHPEAFVGNSVLLESTPLWKEPESAFRTGKCPGENTLKKELWTKFEAASTLGIRYNPSAIRKTARKGFLDMLEEASADEDNSVLHGLR